MEEDPRGEIQIGVDTDQSALVTGSQNVVIQAEQVMLQAAQQAAAAQRDPARMLRVLALLAAPVYNPRSPSAPPVPLDLRQEWHVLADGVRRSGAPILLARLTPPTLDALRYALSPRASQQGSFPHVLHFSGHAWRQGMVLEDELGCVHPASTLEVLRALQGLPHPLDLVVLNGCQSAADAESVAQALVDGGLAHAVVGHEESVLDHQAVAFASRLYAELTNGFPLQEAVDRARPQVTTHKIVLLGDKTLRFEDLSVGEPMVDDRRPRGNLPVPSGLFLGRGRELATIARILAHPPAAGVISGPPGIGKSSLVLEAAARQSWRFPGGVAYAAGPRPGDVRAASSAELIATLAGALGLEAADDLLTYTAANPTLLLMDNLESLPPQELDHLGNFLRGLGPESAALLALRPSCAALEDLPIARPMPVHHGLEETAAVRYALDLAGQRGIALTREQALRITRSVGGHPLLVEQLVALARRRDLSQLLADVQMRQGNFPSLLSAVYAWSADRLDESGRAAWRALPIFSGGTAPEGPLRAAAGEEGPEKLQQAALADFDPASQVWRWHATVAEYARGHWPLAEQERQSRLIALLPAWTEWLKQLPGEEVISRLETSLPNLEAEVEACPTTSHGEAWPFLDGLDGHLPSPERTLILRELVARVWETKLLLLPPEDGAGRAVLLNNLSVAISALGRREEALKAAQEAVDIYRQLARANPQAFLPDLARSLGVYGSILLAMKRHDEATSYFAEGLQHLVSFYQAFPAAFAPLAGALRRDYLRACQEAKLEPDAELLARFD